MRRSKQARLGNVASLLGMATSLFVTMASAEEDLKATLQERYGAMKSAIAARDHEAMGALLAPDFTSVDLTGASKTASQMMSEVDGLKPDPNKSSTTTLLSLLATETSVRVEQKYDMKTIRTGADGVAHQVELVTVSSDTWVKPRQAWLLQTTITEELTLTSDGHLVAHKGKS